METGTRRYTSFTDLGGRSVSLGEVREELGRLPLDMVLGVLSRLSASYLRERERFVDPRFQGRYLADAIVDDFPCVLPRASEMYVPGRVPITGGKHLFIHEHNLCALTKLALRHARQDVVTERLTPENYRRISRLLLVVNDQLSLERFSTQGTIGLKERREFAINTLYCGQFDHYLGDERIAFAALTRLRIILMEWMPNATHFADRFHQEAGLSLELYFDLAAFLLAQVMVDATQVGPEASPWMQVDRWQRLVPCNGDVLNRLMREFTCRPVQSVQSVPFGEDHFVLFDFHDLQKKPFIQAREGEIILPVFSLLLRQLLSYPLIVLRGSDEMMTALGEAYQRYAHSLVVRIARGNCTRFTARSNERLAEGEIDSLLSGGGVEIIFEHKAKHVIAVLGSLSTVRNAIGPSDAELATLATNARLKDKGAVTQPIWQFRALATTFEDHAFRSWNRRPTEVFPIVTLMESFRVDEWVRRGYLDALIEASGTRFPSTWRAIEWMHVSDLEALAEMADRNRLDLVALLRRKSARPWMGFDMLLAEEYDGVIPLDSKLWRNAEALLDRAVRCVSEG